MSNEHNAAFMVGLEDRFAGRPIMSRFEDDELQDIYMCGYDPHQELGIVLPEFRKEVEYRTAALIRENCPMGVPMKLPRNRCEFPEAAS